MNSYGAVVGGIVGVIGGRGRPRLSADSTAIANRTPTLPVDVAIVKEAARRREEARAARATSVVSIADPRSASAGVTSACSGYTRLGSSWNLSTCSSRGWRFRARAAAATSLGERRSARLGGASSGLGGPWRLPDSLSVGDLYPIPRELLLALEDLPHDLLAARRVEGVSPVDLDEPRGDLRELLLVLLELGEDVETARILTCARAGSSAPSSSP